MGDGENRKREPDNWEVTMAGRLVVRNGWTRHDRATDGRTGPVGKVRYGSPGSIREKGLWDSRFARLRSVREGRKVRAAVPGEV